MVSTPGLAARALDLIPLNDRQSCESWEYNKHLCKLFVPDGGYIFICCLGLWGSIESLVNASKMAFLVLTVGFKMPWRVNSICSMNKSRQAFQRYCTQSKI
jgi:hypothetical protein